jgi:hypothetical protein
LLKAFDIFGPTHVSKLVPHARVELPRLLKISDQKVAAMSNDEVCVRWLVYKQLARDQSVAAVLGLPPREAWPVLKQIEADVISHQRITGANRDIFGSTSLYITSKSVKRKVNAMRIIEAARHYLATHDGKLPASLDDITDVPVPFDPLTDRPFEWSVNSKTATLRAPAPPADVVEPGTERAQRAMLEYRLTVP